MPTISLTKVEKSYVAGQLAVRNLDLTIPAFSFTCLLGPSGCGKTTTLRMIAGLEQPTAGEIRIDDRVLDSVAEGRFVPTEKREMGFVFQSYALWPHLTVKRNVDFGLRLRKTPRAERVERTEAAMRALHISEYSDRYPSQLSGGQQQRVSLARMLAVGHEVLLLDEPLSNLDAALRLEMRAELKRLHNELKHTVVFVTHDQLEAMTMATHIAVLNEGELQQLGAPMDVYNRPANVFVAEFVGSPPMTMIRQPASAAPLWRFLERFAPDAERCAEVIGVRPEAVHLGADASLAPPGSFVFDARVTAILPTGSTWIVTMDGVVDEMFAVTTSEPQVDPDGGVTAWIHPRDLHLFDSVGARIREWDAVSAGE